MILEPLEFLRRLAALIPTPRFHTIRYHGFFAAAAKDRAGACALAPPVANSDDSDAMAQNANERRCVHGPGDDPASASNREAMSMANGDSTDDPDRDAPYRKRRPIAWARLLRQVFAIDVLRCPCGGERKVIAALTRNDSPNSLRRYLEHVGEPADPPPTAPAPAPPQMEFGFGAPADVYTAFTTMERDAVDAMPNWDAHIAD